MHYRVNAAHVVSEVFEDGEAALIDLRAGTYFSLNPTGALLWPMLNDGATVDDLVAAARTGTDGGDAVDAAVATFVAELVGEGLLEEVDGDAAPAALPAAPPAAPIPFVAPALERFDDLQDLLLLDPIHDVGDQGWPSTP